MKYALIGTDDLDLFWDLGQNEAVEVFYISEDWVEENCQTAEDRRIRLINVELDPDSFAEEADNNVWNVQLTYEEHGTEPDVTQIAGTVEQVRNQLVQMSDYAWTSTEENEDGSVTLNFHRPWLDNEGDQLITAHLTRLEAH